MKIVKTSLFASLTFFSLATFAQTADEIINKHIDAIGGKNKIEQIKSIQIESSMSIMGNDAPMTTTVLNGKGYKNEVDFNGTKIIQVVTDKGGWMINPMMGSSDPQTLPADQYNAQKEQIYVGGPLMDYASKGGKAELKGKEKVGNIDAYKIEITGSDKGVSTYYIDPATYYLIRAVRTINMNGAAGETSVNFSDFRKTDYGYVVPYAIESNLPQGMTMTATVKKVDVNKDVDPKIFDMPKQ